MTWTKRTQSPKRVAAPHAKRRHQTTIRWTPAELETLRTSVPAGMTLVSWIRGRALESPQGPRPPHAV